MSGHSKWSTIKHKKAATDKARSRVFTKLIKEIVTAARHGGSDLEMNPRLRLLSQKAKASNMPGDTFTRAAKKGAGELEGASYEDALYEGYGPAGVGILVEVLTDNKNRSAAEVRHLFSKYHGSMASPGAVSFNFCRVGQFIFPRTVGTEDEFMVHVLESGADDLITDDEECYEVLCSADSYGAVEEYFEKVGIEPEECDSVYRPKNKVMVTGPDVARVLKLLNALEENEDVQGVHSSFDASEEDMAAAMELL